ncbi:MAG: hypothetical protein ACRDT8_04635 [Micromonosporaceae bacterium]
MKLRRTMLGLAALATVVITAGAAQGSTGTVDLSKKELFAGAQITELSKPAPRWYTPKLHAKAAKAATAGKGLALPDGVNYPTSGLAFTGIRPGAWIIAPAGCTTNFVFGTKGNYYIGTAGHCAKVGEEITLIAAPDVLMVIGKTVKSVNKGIGNDFALIKIYKSMQKHVTPSMSYFGGPTASGSPQVGDIVEHAGHGLGVGTGGTPRVGVVVYRGPGDASGTNAFGWSGVASPGDSGSAVRLANGKAAGDLTHLVVGGKYVPSVVAGTPISRMKEIAGLPLATASNLPNPLI